MIYPVPTHLRDVFAVEVKRSTDHSLQGTLKCPCGSDVFHPLFVAERVQERTLLLRQRYFLRVIEITSGFFLRLGARCAACDREHLLLDDDFHGWNGYVCGVESARARPRPPYQLWSCPRCTAQDHRIALGIMGEALEPAMSESGDVLSEADWFNAFGWFTLNVTCSSCGFGPETIVDYETM